MEDSWPRSFPPGPNLDHLRRQAKTLLAQLKDGLPSCRTGVHRPSAGGARHARGRRPRRRLPAGRRAIRGRAAVRLCELAGAPRHVEQLRGLEGEWRFESLEGRRRRRCPPMLAQSRLLFDGDRFRMESPEANYEGDVHD